MFTLENNIDAAERRFDAMVSRQLPYALARALNDTAEAVRAAERDEMARAFDRPTPFTLNAFFIRRADKSTLFADVTSKDRQSTYLPLQAEGGVDRPLNLALLMPINAGLNAYGNLPRGAIKRMLGKPGVFVARQRAAKTRHLVPGIYERTEQRGKKGRRIGLSDQPVKTEGGARTSRLKLLVKFKSQQPVTPVFQFEKIAREAATRTMPAAFARRLAEALATAR